MGGLFGEPWGVGRSRGRPLKIGEAPLPERTLFSTDFGRGLMALPDAPALMGLAAGAVYLYAGAIPANAKVVKVDATAGAVLVALPPAAASANRMLIFKKIDASANAVTIDPDAAETIDGAATAALAAQWNSLRIVSDGTGWLIC
jgi:hypothetical protein